MQASLPAASQAPAATQVPLSGPTSAAGGVGTLPVVPQFGAAIDKAMAGMANTAMLGTPAKTTADTAAKALPDTAAKALADTAAKAMTGTAQADQSAVPAAQSAATQPVAPVPAPAVPTVAIAQTLPLPLLEPAAGTTQVPPAIGHPATTPTRKGETASRQRPALPGSLSQVEPPTIPSVQAMPLAAVPLSGPGTPAEPPANPRLHMAAIEDVSATVRKPADSATPHLAELTSAELQSAVPDGPSPATHDAIGAADIAPVSQPSSQVATEASLALVPASTQPSATAPATPTAAAASKPTTASPAEQVAPVLVSMAHAPDGAQRLTLRLDPAELGHVQIHIDRPSDAPARVEITVERSETLLLLLRDQPQLQRALDQAGVPSDGRSVTFHVATPEAGLRHDGGSTTGGTGAGSSNSGDASNGASHQGGRPARGRFADADDTNIDYARAAPPGWARVGLDITA
jgi:flagellar hook-length control protein FliK